MAHHIAKTTLVFINPPCVLITLLPKPLDNSIESPHITPVPRSRWAVLYPQSPPQIRDVLALHNGGSYLNKVAK